MPYAGGKRIPHIKPTALISRGCSAEFPRAVSRPRPGLGNDTLKAATFYLPLSSTSSLVI